VAAQEHAENQKYKFEPIMARTPRTNGMYSTRGGSSGILNGPGIQSEYCDVTDIDVDAAGNVYWTESGQFNILRVWRRETGKVATLAGSAAGFLDGTLERARFGGWGGGGYEYAAIVVSRDGKHIFLYDPPNRCTRHVDLEAGTVGSMGEAWVVKDKSGQVYALAPKGGEVPHGRGYQPLKTPPLEYRKDIRCAYHVFSTLDVEKDRLYANARSHVWYWDLKTGKFSALTWSTPADGPREKCAHPPVSAPFKEFLGWSSNGLSISPAGRYLYLGGGDAFTVWRLDLKKEYVHLLRRNGDGTVSFQDGKSAENLFADWPGRLVFAADGTGFWGCAGGLFRLAPVK
jgi:sugar lactone lactonase YvrE